MTPSSLRKSARLTTGTRGQRSTYRSADMQGMIRMQKRNFAPGKHGVQGEIAFAIFDHSVSSRLVRAAPGGGT